MANKEWQLILGIDPGSRMTGYGLIATHLDQVRYLTHGVIRLDQIGKAESGDFSSRLLILGNELRSLIGKYSPHCMVVEKIFLGKNADSAFKLGHARGVVLYEGKAAGMEIYEYATRIVKKTITGSGGAEKDQVQLAMQRLLNLKQSIPLDASDALAMAYHHARTIEITKKYNKMVEC